MTEFMTEAVKQWLLDNGYAEAERGYGHVDADTLAEAIVERWLSRREDDD